MRAAGPPLRWICLEAIEERKGCEKHRIAIHAAALARGEAGAARRPQGRDSRRDRRLSGGAGRLPAVRVPGVRQEGARRRRRPEAGVQGLRAHVPGEERLAARELEARPFRVDGVRGVHGRRVEPARERRALRRLALHLVVHAHAGLRGHALPPPARARRHVPC